MVMNCLWAKQRLNPNKLVILGGSAINEMVEQEYSLHYPKEMRRHDLEDCLERNGYVERPAYEGAQFALTPRGVARVLFFKRMFAGMSDVEIDEDLDHHILSHIYRQADIWAQYRDGKAVCA
ncbi:MAG: hypothetical protein CVV40_00120 [Planctomycetes bacterium HGW-Planctomycetes-2]|nr:MAG: hypothetical protein CVV40_00120 [Planctomycetes bacterium HGW-Planctomycetes-2]